MFTKCIHEKYFPGGMYDPPEYWCEKEMDYDYDCNSCPYRLTDMELEEILADYEQNSCFFIKNIL